MKRQKLSVCLGIVCSGLVLVALLMARSKPAPAQGHERVTVEFRTSKFGSDSYMAGLAWEKLVNQAKHPWISASAYESLGGTYNVMFVSDKLKPEKRARTIYSASDMPVAAAMKGVKPFKRSYRGKVKAVACMGRVVMGLITLNPGIQSSKDLIGKRIALPPAGHGSVPWSLAVINEAWGLKGKVKVEHLEMAAGADALRDGLVDVLWVSLRYVEPTPIASPAFGELFQTKQDVLHFISVSPEEEEIVSKVLGCWPACLKVPPGTLGAWQKQAFSSHCGYSGSYWAHPDVDGSLIYEVVKLTVENIDKFTDYLGPNLINRKNIGRFPITEDMYHPGALKYYKEAGIPIGPRG